MARRAMEKANDLDDFEDTPDDYSSEVSTFFERTKHKAAASMRSPFKQSVGGGPPTAEQEIKEKDENGEAH